MKTLQPEFVNSIPEKLEEGVLYLALEYRLAVHLCVCGCGNEVVTPFSPKDWKLYFDGEAVSLEPSIGNWEFPCQSHYWIKANHIRHARKWTRDEIQESREEQSKKIEKTEILKSQKKRLKLSFKQFVQSFIN